MKPYLIMPMGGEGSRFYKQGYHIPKPLVEINNKPLFYWAAMSVVRYIECRDILFVVLKKHIDENHIDKVILEYFGDAKIICIPDVLSGPVFTALEAARLINDKSPLIFNDCDHMFKCSDLNSLFMQTDINFDGVLLTFQSNQPQFSYIKYGDYGEIVGTVEKEVISDHAICGAYVFKNADLFKNIAREYINTCPYKECFMSGMYNVMCKKGMKVKEYLLDYHVEFGTPEEYETAKKSIYFTEID